MTDLAALGYEQVLPLGSLVESWRRNVGGVLLLYAGLRRDGVWEADVATANGTVVADDEFESAALAAKWGETKAQQLLHEAAAQLAQKGRE